MRMSAPRWLAVKAELRSGATVSMSPPAPIPEITTVRISLRRASSRVCVV